MRIPAHACRAIAYALNGDDAKAMTTLGQMAYFSRANAFFLKTTHYDEWQNTAEKVLLKAA